MASLQVFQGFNQKSLSLHGLIQYQTAFNFLDNANQNFNGRTYEDVVFIRTYDGFYSDFYLGGENIKFNSTYTAATSGVVTGMIQKTWAGQVSSYSWLAQDFSVSAKNFNDAIQTIRTDDDLALMREVLAGSDTIYLGPSFNHIEAYDGDDRFYMSNGNATDDLFGGDGIDTAIYDRPSSTFVINPFSEHISVYSKDGSTGIDSLYGIERLQFPDTSIAFDTSGISGKAFRIYKAAFDRDSMDGDKAGLGYWIAQMDDGMDMVEVAARFIDSDEFRSLYGTNPTNGEFLTKVYNNVLDRDPDAGGYDWWIDQLDNNPEKTWEKVLADFSESPENQANVAELIANGIVYDPWVG